MAEKLTMKVLATELESLRARVRDMEHEFEKKLENVLEKAADKIKSRLDKTQSTDRSLGAGGVDAETRLRLIERAAYLRAEKRGFIGGDSEQDWLEAEREIDHLLLEDMPAKTVPEKPAPSSHGRRKNRKSASHTA